MHSASSSERRCQLIISLCVWLLVPSWGEATIATDDDGSDWATTYELYLADDEVLEIEYIERDDWDGMANPCPECQGTEFDHIRYEGGHYGQYQGTVIQRTDYWDQQGSLYTQCKDCDEVLHKSPAYDILEASER